MLRKRDRRESKKDSAWEGRLSELFGKRKKVAGGLGIEPR